MVESLLKASLSRLTVALFVGFVLFCPGLAALRLFAPEMYDKLEWARLWPLAFATTLPVFAFNWLVIYLWWINTEDVHGRDDIMEGTLVGAALLAIPPAYVPLVSRLLLGEAVGLRTALALAAVTNLALVAGMIVTLWRTRKQDDPEKPGEKRRLTIFIESDAAGSSID